MSVNICGQIDLLFESARCIISKYENETLEKQKQMNLTLLEKNDYLNNVITLNKNLEEDQKDFLKVSFVQKWKTKVEELDKKYEALSIAHEEVIKANKFLNFNLDKITEEKKEQKRDIGTQSDYIQILTSKGARYILKGDKLYSESGKEIGEASFVSG
jgi:hypothetical protein